MTATTLITFPSIRTPAVADWHLDRKDARFESPLSNTFQDSARPGARWVCSLSWPALSGDDLANIRAFLAQAAKGGMRFLLPNYAYASRGVLTGAPLVNGAGQSGLTLVTKGWTISITGIVKAGDLLQLATGQLLIATADANSNASGNTTLAVEPALRTSPADSSVITVITPKAKFSLAKLGNYSLPVQPGRYAALSLDFIEDIS